jgi:hypothetical protein
LFSSDTTSSPALGLHATSVLCSKAELSASYK